MLLLEDGISDSQIGLVSMLAPSGMRTLIAFVFATKTAHAKGVLPLRIILEHIIAKRNSHKFGGFGNEALQEEDLRNRFDLLSTLAVYFSSG